MDTTLHTRIDSVEQRLGVLRALLTNAQRELDAAVNELDALKYSTLLSIPPPQSAPKLAVQTSSGGGGQKLLDVDVYNSTAYLDGVFYEELKSRLPKNYVLRRFRLGTEYPDAVGSVSIIQWFLATPRSRTQDDVRNDVLRLIERSRRTTIIPVFITAMTKDRPAHRFANLPNVRAKGDYENYSLYSSADVVRPTLHDDDRWNEILMALAQVYSERSSTI